MGKLITISVIGGTTIVKEVVDGGTPKIFASNTSRNIVFVDGGIKIMPDSDAANLNNYVIKIAELTNNGIDFTGVATSEDLINKLAEKKAFKQGGGLGVDEVLLLIPTLLSELANDVGFLTIDEVVLLIPTLLSELANDVGFLTNVLLENLGIEFTGVVDLGVSNNINWKDGILFKKNQVSATTFTFSNLVEGKSIIIKLTGNYTSTFPTGVQAVDLTNVDGTKTNYIILTCVDAVTPLFIANVKAY